MRNVIYLILLGLLCWFEYNKNGKEKSFIQYAKPHIKKGLIVSALFIPTLFIMYVNLPQNKSFNIEYIIISFVAFFCLGYLYSVIRHIFVKRDKKEILKGTKVLTKSKDVNYKNVNKAISKNKVSFANIILDTNDEALHFATIGTTGTGKSTAIKQLIHTSKLRGDRHVICDADAAYSDLFFKDGDVIFNPTDPRSVKWDYLGEIKKPMDNMLLASMIVPDTDKADEWRNYARQLLASCSEKWIEYKLGSSDEFIDFILTKPQRDIMALAEGTAASRFFDDGNERMLGSILGTLMPFIEPLRYIKDSSGPLFSIRDWVHSGQGSLFITYRANELSTLKYLISSALALSIVETLSLNANEDGRIWFVVDELDAVGRIHGLKDALARLRKFGGRVVLGFQSISQLRLIYGQAEANTIIENCGNKLILRCESSEQGGTADFASRLIGEHELSITKISRTSGFGNGGGSSTTSTHEKRESAIMASQIAQLANFTGYYKQASKPEWIFTTFQHTDY